MKYSIYKVDKIHVIFFSAKSCSLSTIIIRTLYVRINSTSSIYENVDRILKLWSISNDYQFRSTQETLFHSTQHGSFHFLLI